MRVAHVAMVIAAAIMLAACGPRRVKPRPKPTPPPVSVTPSEETVGDTSIPEQQIDESPEISADAVALLDEGKTAAHAGDVAVARLKFVEAARIDPKFAETHYNLGVLNERDGRYAEARASYNAALDARDDFGPAVIAVAMLMVRDADLNGAREFVRTRLSMHPESNALRNAHNRVRLHFGEDEEVIADSKKVLRRDERNVDAMKNMAIAYLQSGKPELSIAILQNAGELAPDDPEILMQIAMAHLTLDEKHQARKALEDAIAVPGGGTAEVYNNLGVIYHEAGDYSGAERQFHEALLRWPHMVEARLNLGNALKGQQKFSEADAALKGALKIAPKSGDVLYNLGILYLDGDIAGIEAIHRLEQAVAYFEQYKSLSVARPADDPVDDYVAEAQKRIDVETKRAEQLRRASKPAPVPAADLTDGDSSSDEPESDGTIETDDPGEAGASDPAVDAEHESLDLPATPEG